MTTTADDDTDEWNDDTVIDGTPLLVDEHVTPSTMPRCSECGRVAFIDAFTDAAATVAFNLWSRDRCVRSKAGNWWWCGKRWRLVLIPPE